MTFHFFQGHGARGRLREAISPCGRIVLTRDSQPAPALNIGQSGSSVSSSAHYYTLNTQITKLSFCPISFCRIGIFLPWDRKYFPQITEDNST